MKLAKLLEVGLREAEEAKSKITAATDPEVKELEAAMGASLKSLGSNFAASKKDLEKDVEQADIAVNESITAVAVIGILLAMPKVIELLGRGLSGLIKVWKKYFKKGEAKTEEDQVNVATKIIEFSHKWHKLYINGIKGMLKLIGAFKKAGIQADADQTKAAELIYYVIIAGLALYSGVGAIAAFKSAVAGASHGASLGLGALEGAMSSIKSAEVGQFLAKLTIK